MENPLFIRSVLIEWGRQKVDDYLYHIPALKELDEMEFTTPVTFFAGENGSGKSTMLEAIAVASGLNPEGGTSNYSFSTYDDYSGLSSLLRIQRGYLKPEWKYFLRAESFYNVATAIMTKYNDDGKMPNYHARSHGESFLGFIQEREGRGLYLMDEPEAALSVQAQLGLLIYLKRMADEGSQFIIATHSPILLGLPGARILSFDGGQIKEVDYEQTDNYVLTRRFLEDRKGFLKRLLAEEEES